MAEPNPQEDFAKLSNDLAVLRTDVTRLAETLTSFARSEGEAAAEAVSARIRQGKARAEATAAGLMEEGAAAIDEAKVRARVATKDLTAAVERNPLGAVCAALGVGFILGLLSRSR